MVNDSYVILDGRIRKIFFEYFAKETFSVTLLLGARFLGLVLNNSPAKLQMRYEMSIPTALEALVYILATASIRREAVREKLNIIRKGVNCTLADTTVRMVQKDSNALMKSCSHGPLRAVIQPYLQFSLLVIQFQASQQLLNSF